MTDNADTRRLNWIERSADVRATRMRDPFNTMRYWLIERPDRRGHGARGETLRDAIDVAMALWPEVQA